MSASPLLALANKTVTPTPTPIPDSFTMFYPIVSGKIEGEPLYFLKQLRDKITEIMAFGDESKSEVTLNLATKKLLEAEKLVKGKKYEYAKKAFNLYNNYLDSSYKHAVKIKDSDFFVDLLNEISDKTDKYTVLLKQIVQTIPEEQKSMVMQSLSKTEEIQNNLKQF